jgi:single-strand DNA-binding protein
MFNKTILIGNVSRNPEIKNGKTTVAKFSLAVNNRKNKEKEDTMFIDVVSFGKLGEICGEYLSKGSLVLVEGRLFLNTWEQDGQKRSKHEVIAENVQILPKGESKKGSSASRSRDGYGETDIPF